MKCYCGKEFKDGSKLAKHRKKCAVFQQRKYYTKATVEQIQKQIDRMKGLDQ